MPSHDVPVCKNPFCILAEPDSVHFIDNPECDSNLSVASDMVNHPPHYTAHPSGVECIQITEHMGFNVGNAVKYLWRADEKGNAIEDLEKARWYVERELKRRRAHESP